MIDEDPHAFTRGCLSAIAITALLGALVIVVAVGVEKVLS